MKTRTLFTIVLCVGLLLMAVSLSQAQESVPQSQDMTLLDTVGNAFTYQGRLLMDGNPVNGNCDFQFSLWDAESGGTQIGSTQTKANVGVSNGLFSVALDFGGGRFTGDARWLAISVRYPAGSGSYQALTPRQPLTAVPYALSLRPGATVRSGDSEATLTGVHIVAGMPPRFYPYGVYGSGMWGVWGYSTTALGVRGESTDSAGVGVWGLASSTTGNTHGVYGKAQSPDGHGGYFDNTATSGAAIGLYAKSDQGVAISAGGTGRIQSTAKSYVWISGNSLMKNLASDTTRWDLQPNGGALIWRGSATGSKYIYYPVTMPSVLYGQPVKLTKLTVYYRCEDGTKNYITNTGLSKQTDADSHEWIVSDGTDRTSNSATSYSLNLTSNNILSADQGGVGVQLYLHFEDDSYYVQIGGIRLELEHD